MQQKQGELNLEKLHSYILEEEVLEFNKQISEYFFKNVTQ